ncbi:PEP-CTERM sorting domain-containing protein [Thalassotalea psychrophila]|uniref:PEP-CTERM sorting domain-containing protein n=1 Tax=Thalassotalea psychrophila TaxID=3065647 RepID=A0ABY9TPJ6_9GAMM|nr:PEP-CTERM sorting domain-containing protein [Colwelliaceae bacterium SQ149]
MKYLIKFSVVLFAAIVISTNAFATLITTESGYDGPTLDLSAYQNGSYNFTFGPEALPGGITFTAAPGGGGNTGGGSVIGQGSYGLAANGAFGGDAVYIGLNSSTGYADLTFDAEISFFGAFFNYAPGYGAPVISALDDGGGIIESWDLSIFAPISTPGGFNEFEFRGIDLGDNTFKTFRLGGSYILMAATGDGNPDGGDGGNDDTSSIPEPSTLVIFSLGLIGVILRRRNKH